MNISTHNLFFFISRVNYRVKNIGEIMVDLQFMSVHEFIRFLLSVVLHLLTKFFRPRKSPKASTMYMFEKTDCHNEAIIFATKTGNF